MSYNRRLFLRDLGIVVWLPVLPSLMSSKAAAAVGSKEKFIGVFSPSGAYMPGTANGNWSFGGALAPIVNNGHQQNISIVRGLTAFTNSDPHWGNTANFLSGHQILIPSKSVVSCGKSFDQLVAEKYSKPLGSMHVGWRDINRTHSQHVTYSDKYLTTIAWREADRPISNIYDPRKLYNHIFSASQQGKDRLDIINKRKASVLDLVIKDIQSIKNRAGAEDKTRLEIYQDNLRELELNLQAEAPPACGYSDGQPNINLAYMNHFLSMQKMIVTAMNCELISSATIMYDDGVGDMYLRHQQTATDHHSYAHAANLNHRKLYLDRINQAHANLFSSLISELKTTGLMDKTVVVWGSNMSDGSAHSVTNMPTVVASGGAGLRLGVEVGNAASSIPRSNLFVDLAPLFGLSLPSFGGGPSVSNSMPTGIRS